MRKLLLSLILVTIWSLPVEAQTRFYFPGMLVPETGSGSGPTAGLPGGSSAWGTSGGMVRGRLVTTKVHDPEAPGFMTIALQNTGSAQTTLFRQYIKCGLEAQTIDGTLKGQIKGSQQTSATSVTAAIAAYVTSSDFSTSRGALLGVTASDANTTAGIEFNAGTSTNRPFLDSSETASHTLSSVNAQAGDCLIIEVGTRDTSNSTESGSLYFYDGSDSDLPEDNTTTTTLAAWAEFSDNITFTTDDPTKFYLPTTTASDVNPAFDAAWDDTGSALRRELSEVQGASAITAGSTINITEDTGNEALDRQYVSNPLASGIAFVSGVTQVYAGVGMREHANTDDVNKCFLSVRIFNQAGDTVQATLLAHNSYGPTGEFLDTGYRHKTCADGDTVGASYTTVAGDRIVVEFGYETDGAETTPQASANWGEDAAECNLNDTTTTNCAGWIGFSLVTPMNSGVVVTTTSLPNAQVGVAYDSGLIQASGGTPPYSWAEVGSNLNTGACSGLTLTDNMDNTAEVTGTPTTAGLCSFTLEVTDDDANTDQQALTIQVQAAGGLSGQRMLMGVGIN